MKCTRKITENLVWVGADDRRQSLFENIFPIPGGVAYNSYLLLDEKTALMDTVDFAVSRQFFENLSEELADRKLDYLVMHHMEPDHGATVEALVRLYPEVTLVGNEKTMQILGQFFPRLVGVKTLLVKEGDTLKLGAHSLTFLMAPMVHWPETMVSYDPCGGVLFSGDAFGAFGALNGNLFVDETDIRGDWLAEARRYYSNIVGKYGMQVQGLLKKAAALDIQIVCPLHGPVWRSQVKVLLHFYDLWSRYEPEERAVTICYCSMYGNTEQVASALALALAEGGSGRIAMLDLSRCDVSYALSEVFRCSHLVLASPTYNGEIYPKMLALLQDMQSHSVQNRTVALVENGTWYPVSGKLMGELLGGMKNMTVLDPMISLKSAPAPGQEQQVGGLADAILASMDVKNL
ncbi:MAG: FprA family A-type flavoprotein [Oscillospiraceae bacterium]